jgi:hypothetical protein
MPVFDGLFPEKAQSTIMNLLFILAHWHSLAKLSMHTTSTLKHLSQFTQILGATIKKFANDICPSFKTSEMASERDKRVRHATKKGQFSSAGAERKEKHFNLYTYKLHALGDYVHDILLYGPAISFSTQLVCALFDYFYVIISKDDLLLG